MGVLVSHVRRRQLPSYIFSKGYKGRLQSRLGGEQLLGKSVTKRLGEENSKRKSDSVVVNSNQSEKRRHCTRQGRSTLSQDTICHNSVEALSQPVA